jgi:hypothetical protein
MSQIINKPHHCTKLDIWAPRYSSAYTDTNERVVLIAQYKVQYSSPIVIINFSKAKHLAGQRFCIKRENIVKYPLDTNGKIPCYAVPMSAFESWESGAEVLAIANELFPN